MLRPQHTKKKKLIDILMRNLESSTKSYLYKKINGLFGGSGSEGE